MDDQPPRGYLAPDAPRADEVRPLPRHPDLRPARPEEPTPRPPDDGLTPPPSRGRRLLWLVLLAIVVGLVAWWALSRRQPTPPSRFGSGGPTSVGTATVQKGDMPIVDNALGTVTPLATVTVQTQINGQLTEIGFEEGQMVKKGDFLAQIDPRPYQVALEQAQGQLAKDQALLANAKVDLARYEKLVAQNAIASQTLDTQRALVAQDQATVQTDQAQVDAQKLNLIYCHIVAPISGRVGLRQVDAGNYVQTSSTTGIVVLTQLQPISVIFTLPEDSVPDVLKQVHAGKSLQATAFDRTGKKQIETGQLSTFDTQIDTATGTLKLRASFANTALDLFPNQFVNIKLKVDTLRDTNNVPIAAVQRGDPGTFVYVTKPDNTVAVQKVTLGPDDGKNVAVTEGLEPGQVVVTDGADRLKDGAKITVTSKDGQPTGQGAQGGAGERGQGRGEHRGEQAPTGQGSGQAQGQAPQPAAGQPSVQPGGSGGR
jgi:multidrug efflux system membrane fusion protein